MNPAAIILLLAFLVTPHTALASTWEFGTDDRFEKIQDLTGTNYTLCYHYHIKYFIAGVFLGKDGYVLTEKPDYSKRGFLTDTSSTYLPLTKEKIKEMQQAGLLPNPLPAYSIPTGEYVEAFMLWWILLIVSLLYFLKSRIIRWWNSYTAPDP